MKSRTSLTHESRFLDSSGHVEHVFQNYCCVVILIIFNRYFLMCYLASLQRVKSDAIYFCYVGGGGGQSLIIS